MSSTLFVVGDFAAAVIVGFPCSRSSQKNARNKSLVVKGKQLTLKKKGFCLSVFLLRDSYVREKEKENSGTCS